MRLIRRVLCVKYDVVVYLCQSLIGPTNFRVVSRPSSDIFEGPSSSVLFHDWYLPFRIVSTRIHWIFFRNAPTLGSGFQDAGSISSTFTHIAARVWGFMPEMNSKLLNTSSSNEITDSPSCPPGDLIVFFLKNPPTPLHDLLCHQTAILNWMSHLKYCSMISH